jgi:glutamyl-tRNA(Gln) amidotransferase subunit D
MLPETAYLKLGWVLGHTQERDEVNRLMLKSIAGEITERTDERAFLY